MLYNNKLYFGDRITIKMIGDTKIKLQSADADNHCIIEAVDMNGKTISRFGYWGTFWGIDGKRITIS